MNKLKIPLFGLILTKNDKQIVGLYVHFGNHSPGRGPRLAGGDPDAVGDKASRNHTGIYFSVISPDWMTALHNEPTTWDDYSRTSTGAIRRQMNLGSVVKDD